MKIVIIILLLASPIITKAQDVYPPSFVLENCIDSGLIEKYNKYIDTSRIQISFNKVTGIASFYSSKFNGLKTASGELYRPKKYTAASNQQARIHAITHDAFDVHDPIDVASNPHVISTAAYNFSPNTAWVRHSVPFTSFIQPPLPPLPTPAYILVTFATNAIAGGGAANDEVLIDDIQLIYNSSVGITEANSNIPFAHYSTENGLLITESNQNYHIFKLSGQLIKSGLDSELNGLKLNSGVYILKSNSRTEKIFVP